MPLNDRKIIDIILNECNAIDERCKGYRKELVQVISDIITAERQHRIQATNVQQRISDKCNAAAHFLAESRSKTTTRKGDL